MLALITIAALLPQESGPKLPPPAPGTNRVEPERAQKVPGKPINRKIELSPKAQEFIRTLALIAIPDEFEDDKKWGKTKRVQSGVSVKFRDGKLRTHRKWKDVKHGRWQKYHAKLIDPKERFQLRIANVVKTEAGSYHFDILCTARLRIEGRWQDWRLGVPVLRISTDAITDIRLTAHCELDMDFEYKAFPPSVQLKPRVHTADVRIGKFEIRRISHLKGRVAEEFSGAIKSVLTREIANRRKSLPKKLNKKIEKKKDDLKISLGEWLKFSGDKTAGVPSAPVKK
ncbi:MAG: hypothetical protein AB8G99_21975 [Planctomycetaceae bacterium]